MSVTIKKSGPGIGSLEKQLANIQKAEVLVGIPASTALRKGEPINNASLLWLLSRGSPLNNLPATPILEPSIELNKDIITPHLGAAAEAVLQNDPWKAQQELERAGIIAANGAKRYILNPGQQIWPPLKPATIKRKGSDVRNIDTGSMRRAIVSVVREK